MSCILNLMTRIKMDPKKGNNEMEQEGSITIKQPPVLTVTSTSRVDGVHLDEDQHLALGRALATKVKDLFSVS